MSENQQVSVTIMPAITNAPRDCMVYTHCTADEAMEEHLASGAKSPGEIFGIKQITGTLWYIPIDYDVMHGLRGGR